MSEKVSPDFIEKNKEALLQEIAVTLNSLSEAISAVYSQEPDENLQKDTAFLRNILMAVSQGLGYMTGIFNQYWVFDTGQIQEEKNNSIGFVRLNESINKKDDNKE